MEIKIGRKYLVRRGYVTGGGEEFHRDMRIWNSTPLVVKYTGAQRVIAVALSGKNSWNIAIEDLIPYRPTQLENK